MFSQNYEESRIHFKFFSSMYVYFLTNLLDHLQKNIIIYYYVIY